MRRVDFWLGGDKRYSHSVPQSAIDECLRLAPTECRFAYWRGVTGDLRIKGHVLVWTPQ